MTARHRRRIGIGLFAVGLAACGLDLVGRDMLVAPVDEGGAPPIPEAAVADVVQEVDAAPFDAGRDATVPPRCTTGERTWRGRCYRLVDDPLSEPAAEQRCVDEGGHLVTVGSADEEAFLFDAGGSIVRWIGLKTADNPDNDAGRFGWVTGEPTTYRNWYPSDPNELGECVVMLSNDPRWADRACDQTIAYTCERDAAP